MRQNWFRIRQGLVIAGRFPSLTQAGDDISASEVILLLVCGAAAAFATGFLRLGLRIPGNAIIWAVIPMTIGLALVPRRMGGSLMSAGAFGAAAAFTAAGLTRYGSGALVSLCLVGPCMDVALVRVRSGWRLYCGVILSGIAANLAALISRSTSKLLGLDVAGMRPFGGWWSQATLTYTLCGAVAGLIGALCCFRFRPRRSASDRRSDEFS